MQKSYKRPFSPKFGQLEAIEIFKCTNLNSLCPITASQLSLAEPQISTFGIFRIA